jgi:Asp-tRNA(Asn)/Glu-tRNA(Gln) amidotransferase C subunit
MRKIDPKNKVCIYLDQFVVSNLVDETTELWKDITSLLEISYQKNLIYCPLSHQHILETAKKELKNAIIHDDYFRKLSDGYLFKDELFLTTQLISSLIRQNKHTLKTFLENRSFKKMEDIYEYVNEVNKVFDESITYQLSVQNELRKVLDNRIEKKTETQMFDVIRKMETKNFVDRLEEYISKKRIYIRPDNYGKHDFPHWIDQILYILTNKHSFKEKELKLLLKELNVNGFNRIPPFNIKFSLGANLAVKSKQENTSDHIDITRITNGLLCSDIFFTYKKRKFEIIELGLDKLYKTKVYCGTNDDLEEFKEYLSNLIF